MFPAAADVTVLVRIPFPVSGLCTVTENVTVAEPPRVRLPVQVRAGLANDTDPAVAAAFRVVGGVVQHPGQVVGHGHPGVRRSAPVLAIVTV